MTLASLQAEHKNDNKPNTTGRNELAFEFIQRIENIYQIRRKKVSEFGIAPVKTVNANDIRQMRYRFFIRFGQRSISLCVLFSYGYEPKVPKITRKSGRYRQKSICIHKFSSR